jgi:hypothetical protein
MVNFEALCEALDPLGWSGAPEGNIAWKFFKQGVAGHFKAALVHADGSVQLFAMHGGKVVQYSVDEMDWEFLDVLEQYVRKVDL